jgi:hypothetical protein
MLRVHSLKFMRTEWLRATLTLGAAIMLVVLGICQPGSAQAVSYLAQPSLNRASLGQPSSDQPSALLQPTPMPQPSAIEPAPMVKSVQPSTLPEAPTDHRFWNRENSILFATNAAFCGADFVVTKDNLRGGGQELNPVTRVFSGSTAGLAMNFVGEAAGVVGLSYFFHKTGHHKLERAISMLNIGGSAAAVTFDLVHR